MFFSDLFIQTRALQWSLYPPTTEGRVRVTALWILNPPPTTLTTPSPWALSLLFSITLPPTSTLSPCPFFSLDLWGPLLLICHPPRPALTLAHSPSSSACLVASRNWYHLSSWSWIYFGSQRNRPGEREPLKMWNCIVKMSTEQSWRLLVKTWKYVACHQW